MIQTRFDRQNTHCDEFILWCTAVVACINCVVQTVSDVDCSALQAAVDLLICTVNACMQTQHEYEIRHIKETGYRGAPRFVIVLLPVQQQGYVLVGPPSQQKMATFD